MNILLLVLAFIGISIILLISLYFQWKHSKSSVESQGTTAKSTVSASQSLAALRKIIESKTVPGGSGVITPNEAASSVSMPLEFPVNLWELVYKVLENTKSRIIFESLQANPTAYDEEGSHFYILKLGGMTSEEKDISETAVMKCYLHTYDPLKVTPADENGYLVDGKVPLVFKVLLYLPSDCSGGTCLTSTVGEVRKAILECVGRKISRTAASAGTYAVRTLGGNVFGYTQMSESPIVPSLLNISYPSVTAAEASLTIKVSKLVNALPTTWVSQAKSGGGTPQNVLLSGDPGTGKTRLLRYIMQSAAAAGVTVVSASAQDLVDFLRNSAHSVRLAELANNASAKCAVIFVDEAGSLPESTLAALNVLMDGLSSVPNVHFVLATNNDLRDSSTGRPGRVALSVSIGHISREEAEKLYKELVRTHTDLVWEPFPTTATTFTLATVYGLGKVPGLAGILRELTIWFF